MQQATRLALGLAGVWFVGGCRTATRITEVPRVDLELSGGNRGYVIGVPPEETVALKATRQLIQSDVELPSAYKPGSTRARIRLEDVMPAEDGAGAAGPQSGGSNEIYVVQKGDSLWSIAAKPEVYGDGTRWQALLEANDDLLSGRPGRLRAGMQLKIPRTASAPERQAGPHGDDGAPFTK
ncbi:MAG: LysM domain-containing protein [Candidatus Omnitrophota bacterium]|nr:LysM domain-containing protein [Candidatus Omnitrophota bacterium]